MDYSNWTKEEFVAYILLYIANIDLEESEAEQRYILSRVNRETYNSIHDEFDKDNDYQSINKIVNAYKSKSLYASLDELFADVKLMAFADGKNHQMEQTSYNVLKRILED